MKVAIMQPYLFPYLGYWQLLQEVDVFVLYDDVSFIKQSFINRNWILTPNGPLRITFPVYKASSNNLIRDLEFVESFDKVRKTVFEAYTRAPQFDQVMPFIDSCLHHPDRSIAGLCGQTIRRISDHIGISCDIRKASDLDYDRSLPAADRLIDICQRFGADQYINAIGGQKLYSKEYFEARGVELSFLDFTPTPYPQGTHSPFVPYLSIIDPLIWCPPGQVAELLEQYDLV